jgi:hypothetical protein
MRFYLPCVLFALLGALPAAVNAQSAAQPENVDYYIMGGALRGRGDFTWTASTGFVYRPADSRWGLGFMYSNDGHLPNNHRDGFAAQGWYAQSLGDGLEMQLGAGPYVSMNNTEVNGERLNQFRMGILGSAALKWHVLGNGWYLRSQINTTLMLRSFDTVAVLFGVGYDFPPQGATGTPQRLRADVSVWSGISRTTTVGTQRNAGAFRVEAQYLVEERGQWWEPSAYSVGFLSEGDTFITDRKGIPVQAWWRTPPERFVFSFGLGPYLAHDSRRDQSFGLLGILSLRAAMDVFDTTYTRFEIGVMYSRVASFYNKDQDIYLAGIRLYEKR